MCPKTEFKNDILIYETEAFLFQTKSNLDILIQALKYVYPCLDKKSSQGDVEEFKINPQKDTQDIRTKLENSGHKDLANFLNQQYSAWIADMIAPRNTITHRAGLDKFFCFVLHDTTQAIDNPKMPSGENLYDYCLKIYNNLMTLYETVFKQFILAELADKIKR